MKKEILKLTGFTEDEFYRMYPTEEAFTNAYPAYKMKMGGLPEAFPQIATANNFFSYGVPVPPTIHAYGGPVYPQIQTEAQFFSPVYSNSNNAYAVGGSYMEAYPQAKLYPQGPVGGSAFYAMQNGGSSMQEPGKDQTFYTQKTNDFFDKLRQTAYKNIMAGIMNSEDDSSSDMKQLAVGKVGGNQPFNFYIPNNKTSWRNIREQKGKGLGDLTPEQLEAIKTGAANIADISYETRAAILPKNRIKKVNIKFKNQPGQQEFKGTPYLMPGQKGFDPTVPGQPATTTTPAPAQNQQTAPGTQGMSPYGPYMNEYLFGPDNAPSVNAQVAAQQAAARTAASSMSPDADYITNSKYPDLDEKFIGTNMTQRERLLQQLNSNDPKEVEYAKYRIGAMQDWDAMQVGRNSGTSQAPSNTNSMDPNVAKKKAAMKKPVVNQPYIDNQTAPKQNLDTRFSGEFSDGEDNLPFRMGGPYVLPMYQGMTGPSQTGFQAPWQKTLDMVNMDNYKLNAEGKSQYIDPSKAAEPADQGEFEVGYDVSRVKNFDPNFIPKVGLTTNVINSMFEAPNQKKFERISMRPDQWANNVGQYSGWTAFNNPAGADSAPDQMVPVGYTGAQYGGMMMYDTADLFFLTPQMLKKTKGKK